MTYHTIYREIINILENNDRAVLATVVQASGSTPAKEGGKMIVYEDGSILGTVGGGGLEARVIQECQAVLSNCRPKLLDYNLDRNKASELGMVCGGKVTLFIEPLLPSPTLLLVGAGHISREIAQMAGRLDYRIVVIDDRDEFASEAFFPEGSEVYSGQIAELLQTWPITKNTFVVIVTRGHTHDQEALEAVLESGAGYIGMIGSKHKIKTVFDDLCARGYSQELLDKVYAPIGLDIGGETPAEIAVSVLAEIQQVRYKGNQDKEEDKS